MNPITIGLDALLAILLLSALVMGARLNGRLKALKAGHEGFAAAVQELDAAAAKADAALKALHLASEETHDSLLARIETARALSLKLEKASETAEKAAARAEEAVANASIAAPSPAPTVASAPRRSLTELLAARTASPKPVEAMFLGDAPPAVAPSVVATPRRRPLADEDLFADAEEGLRPGLGGLMRMSLAKTSERGAR